MSEPSVAPMILHPDQVDELRGLLETVEDWLRHTSFEVLDDLGEFLAGLAWQTAGPDQLAAQLMTDLGQHTTTLRPTPPATATSTTTEGTPPR